jgi:hypothetical protein
MSANLVIARYDNWKLFLLNNWINRLYVNPKLIHSYEKKIKGSHRYIVNTLQLTLQNVNSIYYLII